MKPKVYLIGVGMGNPDTLTLAAQKTIEACTLLIGAPRLLEPYGHKRGCPLILPEDIARCIGETEAGPVGVLLSGDVGFYSGATALRPRLEGYEVVSVPGISSLNYFCACLGTPWQDVRIVSAHGRAHNAVGEIQCHPRTFLLTGGKTRAEDICRELTRRGLGAVSVSVGERLSYPEQRVVTGTAEALAGFQFEDLAVMLVENQAPLRRVYSAPSISDRGFLRGKVPMTKEEVRVLSVSKLRLKADHILWDVGAGTGSVSIEGALAVSAGQVFSVEKNPDALALLEENKTRFGAVNLTVVSGHAPEALLELPAPDRVFLGGTSGTLGKILSIALEKNPSVRVVVTAVTLETLQEAVNQFNTLGLTDVEVTQIAVTRTRMAGGYHMMDANNPVWIISGEGAQ